MLLPILSSILGISAFLPFNFYPVSFVFLIPLFIFFLREKKFWRLILGTAIFRLFFLLGTVYFTLEPILWTETILIFLGLPISIWLIKKLPAKFHLSFITLPFAWTFFDYLEAHYSLTPTYIATAGNSLASSPFLGLAGFGGIITLTFFVALVNALLTFIVFNYLSGNKVLFTKRRSLIFISVIVLLFSAWQISELKLKKNSADYAESQNVIKFASVSTTDEFNINQLQNLANDLYKKPSDLVIFPEDIFDQSVSLDTDNNMPSLGNSSTLIFRNLAKILNANLVATYDTLQGNKNKLKYDSAILFDTQGNIKDVHNKNRLMFIGEYWPFGNWHPSFYDWLKEKDPSIESYVIFDQRNAYTTGEKNLLTAMFQKNAVPFATAICSEIHYPDDLKKYKENGARFIVNPSSNRWADVGLNQYLYLTENLKKIESAWLSIPIISSGVNDNAGIILPDGQKQRIEYEFGNKNYGIFFGELRY